MKAKGCALAGLLLCVGCGPYFQNRCRDAKEAVDFGFTTSKKPCFGVDLPSDYFNLTPLGCSNIEGTFHGVGARQVGSVPIRDRSWGLLLWGSRKFQLGEFDPNEPRHFSPRQLAELKAAGKPLPTETQRFNNGILRMLVQDKVGHESTFFT